MNQEVNQYITPIRLEKPVLAPSGKHGEYDEMAVDSPFVFWHNGKYYMMHVGFDGIGYQTSIAVSNDLIHWNKQKPIFQRDELSGWDQGGIAGVWILKENDIQGLPKLKKWGGKYWMVYHSYPNAGYEAGPANIGLAFTEDESLQHWERLPQPALRWQDGNPWEQGGLYKGCLIEENGRFYLFYNAKDSDNWLWHEQIGLAVSDNLQTWRRYEETPIIKNTPDGWDSAFCADPCIVKADNRWIMFYYGYNGVHAQEGIAFSDDLLSWEKYDAPILCNGEPDALDALHAHKPSVIMKEGTLYHFYCAVRPSRLDDNACNIDPTQIDGDAKEYRCITVATTKAIE